MKVLLLTDIPPNRVHPAALFLDSLCRLLPEDSLACFCVINPVLDASVTPDLDWLPIQYAVKPLEQTYSYPAQRRLIYQLYNFAWETYVALNQIPKIATEAIEFGRRQGCDIVWCTLEGQTLIRLARRVADGLSVPLRTQVFDPPDRWLYMHRVNRFWSQRITAEFETALRHSKSCAAASWAMAEEYQRKYDIKTVPLVPSLPENFANPPHKECGTENDFIIGMAGQLYAAIEWQALLDALDTVNWQIADREVRLWVFGHNLQLNANSKMNIEFFGYRPQAEVIGLLSKASVLYCAYWFTPLFEESARLSFPSKLVSYLASGRPVLFHGPKNASPHRFLTQHGAGISCHSLNPEEIIDILTRLATDHTLCSELSQRGEQAFRKYLTVQSMRRSFAKFLEVNEEFLRPSSDYSS